MQLSRLKLLALDTRLQLLTLARTRGTILAKLSAVLSVVVLVTLALAAHTLSVAAAQFSNVFSVRRDAGLIAGAAFAGGVPSYVPFRVTFTFAANAFAMIRSRAQQTIVSVARKVVAFAILAGHLFFRIFAVATLAFAADTITAVVANC